MNKSFLLGLGVGLVLAGILYSFYTPVNVKNIPKEKIEAMARELGMMYPDEIKAYFENDKK
ncbi:hypothetical protein SAMN05660865_00323 [Caloramator fervidus]|uniref:Uncharacterized protein n=1 Tax=Caloramator fervidus TaxID=29344 RepID=A0A1H5SAL5_9CLOT|nr:hypothetical protein [Caloramator fervidus]SEF47629.1 hypothetical protein SAMN05660865_00323 [Caloramator fervidus]